jgi:hypothetical protein
MPRKCAAARLNFPAPVIAFLEGQSLLPIPLLLQEFVRTPAACSEVLASLQAARSQTKKDCPKQTAVLSELAR